MQSSPLSWGSGKVSTGGGLNLRDGDLDPGLLQIRNLQTQVITLFGELPEESANGMTDFVLTQENLVSETELFPKVVCHKWWTCDLT